MKVRITKEELIRQISCCEQISTALKALDHDTITLEGEPVEGEFDFVEPKGFEIADKTLKNGLVGPFAAPKSNCCEKCCSIPFTGQSANELSTKLSCKVCPCHKREEKKPCVTYFNSFGSREMGNLPPITTTNHSADCECRPSKQKIEELKYNELIKSRDMLSVLYKKLNELIRRENERNI